MNNELTTTESRVVNYNPENATLLEMRADSTRFPRIKTMPREQVVDGLTRIVSQAFLYRGQAADATNIQFISSALAQELLEDKRFGLCNLSLAEIQAVIKRAVLGGSEMFGISVASLYKILLEFAKGEGHNNQEMVDASDVYHAYDYEDHPGKVMLQAYTGEFIRNHKSK